MLLDALNRVALLQWADVVVVAEGCAELDKLKQVRRQGSKSVSMQLAGETIVVQQKLGQGAFASVYQVSPFPLYINSQLLHVL